MAQQLLRRADRQQRRAAHRKHGLAEQQPVASARCARSRAQDGEIETFAHHVGSSSSMARTCHCTEGCSAANAASRGASHSEATDPLAEIASIGRVPRARSRTASQAVAELRERRLHGAQQSFALGCHRGSRWPAAVARPGQQARAQRRLQPADLVAYRAGADMQRQLRRARNCRGGPPRRKRAVRPEEESGRSSPLNHSSTAVENLAFAQGCRHEQDAAAIAGGRDGAFRPEALAHDERACAWRIALGHRCSACSRWASASRASPSSASSSPGCSAARPPPPDHAAGRHAGGDPAAPVARSPAHDDRPPHRGIACRRRCAAGCTTRSSALGPAWFGAERTGGVMLSIVDGVEQLQTFFGQYIPQVTIAACAPVAIFAFMAFWDVPVATVMLAAALFTLMAPSVVHKRTGRASRERQRAFKAFGEEFLDAVQGLPTLKAFGQSGALAGCWPTRRGSVRQHVPGARHQHPDARHHRPRLRARGRRGAGAGCVARPARRDEPGGTADRADGRHRDLPPAARPAHACCTRA